MGRSDDLSPFLARPDMPGGSLPVGYRQGTIKEWNSLTAENVVEVAGAELSNLPILNTSEALMLVPGDTVGLIAAGPSWAILGRLTIPGTTSAASALAAIGAQFVGAEVTAQHSTSSTSYVDLTGGPTVTAYVRTTGRALVVWSCQIGWVDASADGAMGGDCGVSIDAAAPTSDSRNRAFIQIVGTSSNTLVVQTAGVRVIGGLSAGAHTFTLQYRSLTGGKTADFDNRSIAVLGM